MHEPDFADAVETIAAINPQYHRDAYLFLREALDYTQKALNKNRKKAVRHITGQELLTGIKEYGLAQFGPMTLDVFAEWGARCCEDFGEIVFNLVEVGLLSKTEQDSRDDFKGGYDFSKAFREPFLPASKIQTPIQKS